MLPKIAVLFILISCSHLEAPKNPEAPKEFSRGEVILATELLTRVFDQEMAPLSCVPDTDEASLLLRTIRPRMEVVQDDLEAMLDDQSAVKQMIETCNLDCTCNYIDGLIREHLVALTPAQKKLLNQKNTEKELSRCMNFAQTTFCQGDLYKELNREKSDFSFVE